MAITGSAVGVPLAVVLDTTTPTSAGATTIVTYKPGTPTLATITSPTGCSGTTCAPWNTSQGTSSATAPYTATHATKTFVLPSYHEVTGSNTIPKTSTTNGKSSANVKAPNLAVYPSATSGTSKVAPYPSGVVGTPGPLDDYCGTGAYTKEYASTRSPTRQPAGTTLPFAPAYFPHVVKNSTGSLTGYFDYRPKDEDEALVAATATATGKHWTYKGEALEENPGYCASTDINDDGEGHANLVTVDGTTFLYTLPRAAGDTEGVGLIVHKFDPTKTHPLGTGTTALPRSEKVGIDPDAFATAAGSVTNTASTLAVTTTGTSGSTERLMAGGFLDITAKPTQKVTYVFDCTGVTANSLTGCATVVSGKAVTVSQGDLIEQVIGFTGSSTTSIPKGPGNQKTIGTGGLKTIKVYTSYAGTVRGFTLRSTGTTLNANAPNRIYVDGTAVYCSQGNTNPTTAVTGCTTGPTGATVTVPAHSPITSDPIIPKSAYTTEGGHGMTSGLVAPDGIVGVLPTYPGAPTRSKIIMYTEKELNWFVAGVTPKTTVTVGGTKTKKSTFGSTIVFLPGPYFSQDFPSTVTSGSPVTVTMGDQTSNTLIPVKCTGLTTDTVQKTISTTQNLTYDKLTGCSYPSGGSGQKYTSSSLIGAPGATTVPYSTLKLTGEGKTTVKKLDKNNEDYTVLRVAYTTTGAVFKTTGLANTGVISGKGTEKAGSYSDINDPSTTTNPTNGSGTVDLNEYAKTAGTADAVEMRWVGSAGSIITNPDGSIGLFLSGSWAADGDSDAFNQIFYSSSRTGEVWTVPRLVLSTDYTFSASQRWDNPSSATYHKAITISAYYEGRAYGPSVVQHSTGSLTMVFAGYRLPKTIETVGKTVGTGYTGASTWTITSTDAALYRNILSVNLKPFDTTTTTVSVSNSSPVVGQDVTLTATVATPTISAAPTGTVTFKNGSGTTLCTASLDGTVGDDAATCQWQPLNRMTTSVSASYGGSSTFETSQSTPSTVAIEKDSTATSTVIVATAGNVVVGLDAHLEATVSVTTPGSGRPTGTVSFATSTGTHLCTGPLPASGADTAACTAVFSSSGSLEVSATYGGDANDDGSTSGTSSVTVAKGSTTTSFTVTPTSPVVGKVRFNAQVTSEVDNSDEPTGTVKFVTSWGQGCNANVAATASVKTPPYRAVGSCTATLPSASTTTVTATYGGNAYFSSSQASSTLAVGKATTSLTVSAAATGSAVTVSNPVVWGQTFTVTATVTAAPTAGAPTGTVKFSDSGVAIGCTHVALVAASSDSATAACTTAYPTTTALGTKHISASYTGASSYGGSSNSTAVALDAYKVAVTLGSTHLTSGSSTDTTTAHYGYSEVTGQTDTVPATVTVLAPGHGTPTGTLDITTGTAGVSGSCTAGSVVLTSSAPDTATGSCTIASATVPDSEEHFTVAVTLSSSPGTFVGGTNLDVTVSPDSATTHLTVTPTNPVVGQLVQVAVTVDADSPGSGTPRGTVTVQGSQVVCSGANTGSGFSCETRFTTVGSITLHASETSTGSFEPSTATAPLVVTKAKTSVTASTTPVSPMLGHRVTLKATVAVQTPGSGTPTGTVTFATSGGTTLCVGTLGDGSPDTVSCHATLETAPGSVTATYGGDPDFAGSNTSVPVTLGLTPTTTKVAVAPTTPEIGQSVTLTATVTATGGGTPTGTVTFTAGATTLCTAPLVAGTSDRATCSASFATRGNVTVKGTFDGDSDFARSTSSAQQVTVSAASTAVTVTAIGSPVVVGQTAAYTATVAVQAPGSGTPAGTVTFTLSDPAPTKGAGKEPALSCAGGDVVHLSGGQATCTVGKLVKAQSPVTVKAVYAGTATAGFGGSSGQASAPVGPDATTVTVTAKTSPSPEAKGDTFTGQVAAASPGSGDPAGTVTWTVTSATGASLSCKAGATAKVNKTTGKATCAIAAGELLAAKGPYTVKAHYGGSTSFSAGTGLMSLPVTKGTSKLHLSAVNPSSPGSAGSVTVTVKGSPASAGTPTGTVTFTITPSGSAPAVTCTGGATVNLVSGTATCNVPTSFVLAGSPYSVKVVYSGDGNFTGSTGTKTVRVRK